MPTTLNDEFVYSMYLRWKPVDVPKSIAKREKSLGAKSVHAHVACLVPKQASICVMVADEPLGRSNASVRRHCSVSIRNFQNKPLRLPTTAELHAVWHEFGLGKVFTIEPSSETPLLIHLWEAKSQCP